MKWALLALLLGCSSSDDSTTGAPIDPSDPFGVARAKCVDTINGYRATLGLPALTLWAEQGTCADGQAKSDSESGAAHGAFGKCTERAQNECPGWAGPPETLLDGCLKMMWAEGPGTDFNTHGHYINMSSKTYTKVACGFYQTPGGKWWSVQDFR